MTVAMFLITLPIIVSANVAVRGYKFKKGRDQNSNLRTMMVGDEKTGQTKIGYTIRGCFTTNVKTNHIVSGSHIKDYFRTQVRHFVVLDFDENSSIMLGFSKQFWNDDIQELENPEFLVKNLKHLDVRFHSHNGTMPIFLNSTKFEYSKTKEDRHSLALAPEMDESSTWFHRGKEWELIATENEYQVISALVSVNY